MRTSSGLARASAFLNHLFKEKYTFLRFRHPCPTPACQKQVDPQFKLFARYISFSSVFLRFYAVRFLYQESFKLIPFAVLMFCRGQSVKCKNKKGNYSKTRQWVLVHCTALQPYEIYISTKFLVNTLVVLELCPGQSSKCKINKEQNLQH